MGAIAPPLTVPVCFFLFSNKINLKKIYEKGPPQNEVDEMREVFKTGVG